MCLQQKVLLEIALLPFISSLKIYLKTSFLKSGILCLQAVICFINQDERSHQSLGCQVGRWNPENSLLGGQ